MIVPKVESADELLEAEHILFTAGGHHTTLQALIETPLGVQNADSIARATPRLQAAIIGYADLGAALGRSRSALPEHWLAVQDRILIACRAAGVAAIDGPFLGITDDDAFRRAAHWTSALGFDGKWVIHPAQIDSATTAFTPSDDAVNDARRVLTALEEAETPGFGCCPTRRPDARRSCGRGSASYACPSRRSHRMSEHYVEGPYFDELTHGQIFDEAPAGDVDQWTRRLPSVDPR